MIYPHKQNISQDPLFILIIIYLCFSLSVLSIWTHKKRNTVTGDEPHYLVISSGIVNYATLEQTKPYQHEFKTKAIFKAGLALPNAIPSPQNTHTTQGPHGLYNVHNIGLPILLALPFLIGGVLGAKLFMVLVGCLTIAIVWRISGIFSNNTTHRFLSTLATCIAIPLIPASNQIYPDILAGTIALCGLYWFMTSEKQRTSTEELCYLSLIVFLPWLQIKLFAPCVILLIAMTIKTLAEKNNNQRIFMIFLAAGISFITLAAYNHYAFGKFSGPYESGALEISKTALMVLWGLFLDQNQGFLLQNPILFVGVFSIGALFFYNRTVALLSGLVFLSLIVPNAMHPNWYGGWSFSGRFAWSAGIVFMLPTLLGLTQLAEIRPRAFNLIISLALLLQLYFFSNYFLGSLNLYNQNSSTYFHNYSLYYYPFHSWMPALYNSTWAFTYLSNYSWLIFIFILLMVGFCRSYARIWCMEK
jgi:hypothetical protein